MKNLNVPDKHKHLPVAVCCVIRNSENKVLLVSRKDDPTSFGLPGGKVDLDETPQEAIIREVREETGLDIVLGPSIYKKMCPKHAPEGQDFYAFAFVALSYSGRLATQETGIVKWGTWRDQEDGQFADYNRGVLACLHDFDWHMSSWRYLADEESTGMGIPLLKALNDGPAKAEELAERLGYTLEHVTNALLNLGNVYLVTGFEGSYYILSLTGKKLLEFEQWAN